MGVYCHFEQFYSYVMTTTLMISAVL